jgi:hypothetical protein
MHIRLFWAHHETFHAAVCFGVPILAAVDDLPEGGRLSGLNGTTA